MPETTTPRRVADLMVELLLEDQVLLDLHRILYPACGDGQLIEAVHDHVANERHADLPEEVAVEEDSELAQTTDERFEEVRVIQADFLDTELRLGDNFDYILCNPPIISWENQTEEYRKERATDFGFVSADDTRVNEDMLFFEQALRYLKQDGRAVFFTSPDFKTAETAAELRNGFFYRVQQVEDIYPDAYSEIDERRVLTTISGEDSGTPPVPYEPAEFEALLGRQSSAERPFFVNAIMTASPDGYSPDTPVSEAYLDLLYEDYDAAPVYRDPKSQTDPVGYVSRRDLRADKELKVNDVVRPLDDEILVDRNAPLSQAIETLGDQRFFLVGSPDKIQGIVTRFDLNRLPVFMYLYDRFSEVEIGFRRLLRQEAPDWEEQTVQNIPSTTPSEIRVGPLSDAKFSHLRRIIEELGLDTYIIRDISGYAASLEDIVQLRNDVAHYRPIIHTMRDDSGVDDARSGTRLAAEYRLIEDCIRGLPLPESR